MARIDVFNGDADGLCALHQLRLEEPARSTLVTGVKRDVRLLARVQAKPGDVVTVLDVSLTENRDDLERVLAEGAHVRYFDHHHAGNVPDHPALDAHIDPAADTCTSLIVDRFLGGRWRAWAIAAAFGDNLHDVARRVGADSGHDREALDALQRLGECLNYNAYGETVDDLHFHPADLYRAVSTFADPFAFMRETEAFARLKAGYAEDLARAQAIEPSESRSAGSIFVLPRKRWARRVIGSFANRLANAEPSRAHAVLAPREAGGYIVSVRAPLAHPEGADELCLAFPSGGGRRGAGGISALPESRRGEFARKFFERFGASGA